MEKKDGNYDSHSWVMILLILVRYLCLILILQKPIDASLVQVISVCHKFGSNDVAEDRRTWSHFTAKVQIIVPMRAKT